LPAIFLDWEVMNPCDIKTAKAFEDAIIEVSERYGEYFNDSVREIPQSRTSKGVHIRGLVQKNEKDLIPVVSSHF
jgi:hypothetical protein